jgi:apolipoprotein N-acyltransferase
MFLALDLFLDSAVGGMPRRRRWAAVLGLTWPVGMIAGGVTGDWVVNTAHVFGGMPLPLAWAVAWLGYGTLIGLELFVGVGLPFALAHGRPWLQLVLVALWPTVFQVYAPRFLFWTFGQLMHPVPALTQAADIAGSAGLNLWLLPLQWLIFALLRSVRSGTLPRTTVPRITVPRTALPRPTVPRPALLRLAAGLAAAFALSGAYGVWRMGDLEARQARGAAVQLVGIQPNFSLKSLASNPDLSPSDREQGLAALVGDSNDALTRGGVVPGIPVVVLWPESVYPASYFDAVQARATVEAWARTLGVHLVLASVDTRAAVRRPGDGRRRVYGAAIHVPPAGGAPEVYHKLTLIPFGETVPLGDVFPWWRDALLAAVRNMSDFEPGRAHTVFEIAPGVKLAPLICFDATSAGPTLGMAAGGANVGVVLANLAWFGRTSASAQFEWYVRARAIENRIPFLLLSQNGESVLLDARGESASPRLGQFEVGALSLEVHAGPGGSFFGRHAPWIHAGYALALLAALVVLTRRVARNA